MSVLNLPAVQLFAGAGRLPYPALAAGIIGISLAGTYSLQNNLFDVWVALLFGVLGFAMKRFDYPAAPLVLGLVLGPLLEISLRQALTISHGSLAIFATRPTTAALLTLALVVVLGPVLYGRFRRHRSPAKKEHTS